MELESFMEENMVAFLDEKIARRAPAREREEEAELYEIQKDYAKEVDNALQKNDFGAARSLFEELKNKYEMFPKESPMKKTVYSILDEVFEKMRKYVEKREKNKVRGEDEKIDRFEFAGKEIALPSAPIPVYITNKPDETKHVEMERIDMRKINEEKRKLETERVKIEKEKEAMRTEQERKNMYEKRKKQEEEQRKLEEESKRKEIEEEQEKEEKAEQEKRIETESIKKAIEERKKQRDEQFEKLIQERKEKEEQRILEREKKEKILAKIKEHESKKEAEKEKPGELKKELKRFVFERDFPEVKHISEKYIEEMYREGIFYLLQKDYDKSKETFQKILKYKPNHLASKIRLEEIENKINPNQNTDQNIEAKKWTQL